MKNNITRIASSQQTLIYQKKNLFLFIIFNLLATISYTQVTIYWVGDGLTNNWNDASNWSDISAGNGTLTSTLPLTGDVIIFNGVDANSNKNCILNIAVQVNGCQISSGYSGSIDINGNNLLITGNGFIDFRAGNITDNLGGGLFSINTTNIANFRGTTFDVDVIVSADIKFGGSTFNGDFTGTRIGMGNSYNGGTNIFNGDFEITASQISGYFWMAGNNSFNSNLTVNSTTNQFLVFEGATLADGKVINVGGVGFAMGNLQFRNFTQIGLATQSITLSGTATTTFSNGTIFNGDLIVNTPNLSLNGLIANGTTAFFTSLSAYGGGGNVFSSPCSLTHSGSSSFRIGQGGADIFNDTLTLTNIGTELLSVGYSSTGHQYNGDIIINSTSGYGIYVGESGGTSTLSASSSITIGSLGFSAGRLRIHGLNQLGTSPLTFDLTGASSIDLGGNSIFNGVFNATSPNVFLNGATFNNVTNITKTNGVININNGGNTFNASTSLRHNGPWGQWRLATADPDVFNDNATFIVNSGGDLYPAYSQSTSFAGNISFNSPSNNVRFGEAGGTVIFNSTNTQTISDITPSQLPVFNHILMNNSGAGVTLARSIQVNGNATFTNGILYSTTTNLLTFSDNSTTTGASNISFVDGPIDKIGNDAFTFPTGDAGTMVYAPVSISAPSTTTDIFTANYFNSNPNLVPYNILSKDATLDYISICEYWTVDRTAGTSNVKIILNWDTHSCSVLSLSELVVTRWNGTKWKDHGNGGTTGNIFNGSIETLTNVSSFSPFTLARTTPLLPIKLIKFEASLNEDKVDLFWATSSEINNDYFTIERSLNGIDWEEVSTIKSKGNSNQNTHYFERDAFPFNGTSYYRLKQTDYNGHFEYSGIKAINITSFVPKIVIYPNPTENKILIKGNKDELEYIRIHDAIGQDITSLVNIVTLNSTNIEADLSPFPQGTYIVRTKNAAYFLHRK